MLMYQTLGRVKLNKKSTYAKITRSFNSSKSLPSSKKSTFSLRKKALKLTSVKNFHTLRSTKLARSHLMEDLIL